MKTDKVKANNTTPQQEGEQTARHKIPFDVWYLVKCRIEEIKEKLEKEETKVNPVVWDLLKQELNTLKDFQIKTDGQDFIKVKQGEHAQV
jgi:hypothetical protein